MAAPSKTFTVITDARIDADSPWDETVTTDLRDNDIHLEEWLGKNYTAAVDHDHDGVNSAGLAANTIGNSELDLSTSGSGSQVIAGAATYLPPARLATYVDPGGGIVLQVYVSSSWRESLTDIEGCVYSDGANVRFRSKTSTRTLYWIDLA